MSDPLPSHVAFTRFVSENLAFFDYAKFDELQHLIECIEKVMANTGTPVAHMVDVDILRMLIEKDVPMANGDNDITAGITSSQSKPVDPARSRELTVYVQILLLLWETRTYLRRLWNVSKHQAATKGKASKETVRALQRIPNSTNLTERYLARSQEIMTALETPEGQLGLCTSFSEVMAVDSELRVDKEDAEGDMDTSMTLNGDGGYETPSERGESATPGSGQKRGRKRKSIDSNQNTPRKKGRSKKSSSVQGRSVSFA
jgi:cohesin loading factor subunit SCC2